MEPFYMSCECCGCSVLAKSKRKKYCTDCAREIGNAKAYERARLKKQQKQIAADKPKNTLSVLLTDLSKKGMSYAEYQRAQTLKMEGHGIK